MMKQVSQSLILFFLLLSVAQNAVFGYRASPVCRSGLHRPSSQLDLAAAADAPSLSASEEKVCDLLNELHDSKLQFRIVVVGNGAILESTNLLGPAMKMGQSPATGANLVTFASNDQSFEFHLMIAQVSKVAMVEKPSPVVEGKTMRVLRFLNVDDKSICSLILAEDSADAAEWYQGLMATYGPELNL